MHLLRIFIAFILISQSALAQQQEGVILRCGASSGHAFHFKDETTNPNGPNWTKDSISTGKIILVRYGDEWDILFDDSVGSYGYRQDGARVIPLLDSPGMLTVGAFGAAYVDIYTFDFKDKILAWSRNKLGPILPKVAAYKATCE
ncbi:hypothetical protein [Primorskyibacter flagellatus]|uniref:hypothetical protein n=1 Tax=Primorskyibacter flagellatus TaxID=1387277 RepID=UPI0009FF8BEC|nr:hypothetical protein [Primorskyibacter flagellatus]